MSKSKTNFNTFLSECEEYEPVGTNGNRRERHHHQHDRCASASVATTNNGNNGNNIFLNSNSNYANANAGATAVVDSSKLVLNDDNFPSLSSKVNVKSEIQNNKINFKNALSSSSHILLQQQHEQQKRLAAIAAASTFSNVSHILVKKESEYIANKIILSKRFSASNEITSIKSKRKISNNDEDDDDDDDDDDDYENDGYDD
jgi:hypothetical protein